MSQKALHTLLAMLKVCYALQCSMTCFGLLMLCCGGHSCRALTSPCQPVGNAAENSGSILRVLGMPQLQRQARVCGLHRETEAVNVNP